MHKQDNGIPKISLMNQSFSCIVVLLKTLERRKRAYLNISMLMLDIFVRNISHK